MNALETIQIVPLGNPADLVGGAFTGEWISLKKFNHCIVVIFLGDGTDAEDVTVTLQQATAADGTGAKALNFNEYHTRLHATDLNSITQWTKVTGNSANTITHNGEETAGFVIEFDTVHLDRNNGFAFVNVTLSDPGATGVKLAGGCYILTEPTYSPANVVNAQA